MSISGWSSDVCSSDLCYAMRGGQRIWIGKPNDGLAAVPGNGIMPGFLCESQAAVDAAHAAALAHGGTNEGNPGPRPLYGPDFYGAYARRSEARRVGEECVSTGRSWGASDH